MNWDVENVKKGMKSVDNGKIWGKEGKYGKILFEITEITTNLLLAELALICHQNLYDDIPILSRIRAPKLDLYCLFPAVHAFKLFFFTLSSTIKTGICKLSTVGKSVLVVIFFNFRYFLCRSNNNMQAFAAYAVWQSVKLSLYGSIAVLS